MKRIAVVLLMCAMMVVSAFAQAPKSDVKVCSPINVAMDGDPEMDVVGLRLSGWAKCRQFTGLDLGIGGQSLDAYGLQIALLRNKVLDKAGAMQLAIGMNSAADMSGIQLALWNEATLLTGIQLGLFNTSSDVYGLQLGLINVTDTIYGFQFGLINIIRSSPYFPFFPILNTVLVDD